MERRTKLLLAGLAAVLVIWALMSMGGDDGAAPAIDATERGGGSGRPAAGQGERDVVALSSVIIEEPPGELQPGRNPFRFYEPPPPPRRDPPPRRVEPPRVQPQPRPQPVRDPTPPKPQPPPVTYQYLGSFGSESRRIAVFTDGETIVNARVGDVLDGKFRVARIGYESADIAFVDFPDVPPERLPVGQ